MPKYLVLHGYFQSADIISKRLLPLLPKQASYTIPDAPLPVDANTYGWFPLNKIDLSQGTISINSDDIEMVLNQDLGTDETEFDGVIAFSQGCLAAIVLLASDRIRTKKLLLFSPIPAPITQTSMKIPKDIECLVYIGQEDPLIQPQCRKTFVDLLKDNRVEIIEHRWGHVIPSTSEYKQQYALFLGK